MAFESIRESIKKRYPSRPLEAAQIVALAQKALGSQAQAISYFEGSLKIAVENNYIASEMRMQSQNIIQAINKKLGKELIERLIFRVG